MRMLYLSYLSRELKIEKVFTDSIKFMFSKKATKIEEIFTVDLMVTTYCQIDGEILWIFVALSENVNFIENFIYMTFSKHFFMSVFNINFNFKRNFNLFLWQSNNKSTVAVHVSKMFPQHPVPFNTWILMNSLGFSSNGLVQIMNFVIKHICQQCKGKVKRKISIV